MSEIKTIKCIKCGEEKTIDNFTYDKQKRRYRHTCHDCRKKAYHENPEQDRKRAKEYYQKHREEMALKGKLARRQHKENEMWKSAKERAKKQGVPFEISVEDIVIPEYCPVLGLKLENGDGKVHRNSPTLDKIIPQKGYVKGNIIVVSWLANTIKNCGTIEQIQKVADFYSHLCANDDGKEVATLEQDKEREC